MLAIGRRDAEFVVGDREPLDRAERAGCGGFRPVPAFIVRPHRGGRVAQWPVPVALNRGDAGSTPAPSTDRFSPAALDPTLLTLFTRSFLCPAGIIGHQAALCRFDVGEEYDSAAHCRRLHAW